MERSKIPIESQKESRIPVPSSRHRFQRSSSMIIDNSNYGGNSTYHALNRKHTKGLFSSPTTTRTQTSLQRGHSFMERGEKRQCCNGEQQPPTRPQRLEGDLRQFKCIGATPPTPHRIRSLSLSLSQAKLSSPRSPLTATSSSPKTPPTSPSDRRHPLDWESDSITSMTSITSVGSCDHASIAKNGTTFSGRNMKYVFHCNQYAGQNDEEYLTPTQRVHRQVKKLKQLLQQARKDLDEKDSDILKLTKEVVELRLYKAALNSPDDKSQNSTNTTNTIDTIKENCDIITNDKLQQAITTIHLSNDNMNSSFNTDSGHYDDFAINSSTFVVEQVPNNYKPKKLILVDKSVGTSIEYDHEHQKLINEYEQRIQELIRTHDNESHQLKQKHNDKIEELLQRITEINTRYWQLVPELELAKEKIKELENQLDEACKKLQQYEYNEEKKQQLNQLTTTTTINDKSISDFSIPGSSRISVPELLEELQITKNELDKIKDLEYASTSNNLHPLLSAKEALSLWVLGARKAMYKQLIEAKNKNKIDPEITLQFLKSAVYYFLTDKENSQGHLKAIESILGFTPNEISNIDKARFA